MASAEQARTPAPFSAIRERSSVSAAAAVLAKLIGSAALLFSLSGLAQHFHITGYAYLSYSLIGSLVIYLWTRPSLRSLAGTAVLGVAFAIAYTTLKGEPVLGSACAFLGLGSLGSLGLEAIWRDGPVSRTSLDTCITAGMFPLFLITSGICLGLTTILHPKTLDLYLYAFDARLGIQPSFLIGRLFSRVHALRQLCYYGYESLPLAMALAFALERSRRDASRTSIMLAFTAAAAGGFLLYNLFPAAGPIHIYASQFPFLPPPAGLAPFQSIAVESAPRNAMPSVHITMALLIFWNSRRWPIGWRVLAILLPAITILATLGFGEHYLVDLCVAVPFALFSQSVGASGLALRTKVRAGAMAAGGFSVLAWLLYLRIPNPIFPGPAAWVLLFATVVVSLFLEARLYRAARAES